MHNPYQPPKSTIVDLSYQPIPQALKPLYWLMGLAVACSALSMLTAVVVIWQEEDVWISSLTGIQLLLFSVFILAGYGLIAIFYYFLVFRPLQQRKRSTSRWWFTAIFLWAALWFGTYLIPSTEVDTSTPWLETLFSVLELGLLTIGAFLARRPALLEHLPN